jgi:pimeloyl-ACP methyl ester carboxylesterase
VGAPAETLMPGRTTIVFLHGTRLTAAMWAPQIAALGDEFDCLALDLPGHGTRPAERFSLAGAADAVAEVIATQGGGQAIVVGWSLGGYVAMELAARWPDRVAGLVLAGATADPTGPWIVPYNALALGLRVVPTSWLDRLHEWFFRRRYPPSIAEPILAAGFAYRAGSQAVRAVIGERFRPRLARYPGRTLIINGEFDLLFRLAERSFAGVATDPSRVLIRGSGHRTNLDQPDAFTAAIRLFATGQASSPAARRGSRRILAGPTQPA